jgi:hypothetical protein
MSLENDGESQRKTIEINDEIKRRFVEVFMGEACGDASESCRIIGLGSTRLQWTRNGHQMMHDAEVQCMVHDRIQGDPRIARRDEIQRFWTRVMRDSQQVIEQRIAASVHLAKSRCMFVSRKQVELSVGDRAIEQIPDAELIRIIENAKKRQKEAELDGDEE